MATLLSLPAPFVSQAHTGFATLAFVTALFLGWASGLWEQLCENSVAGWPVEWFPSVSATIGDHAASRAPFQIIIALTATPRFVLLGLQWIAHRYPPQGRTRRGHEDKDGQGHAHALSTGSASVSTSSDDAGPRSRKTRSGKGYAASAVDDEKKISSPPPQGPAVRSGWVDAEVMFGVARTFCCGGWMYITSRDQHDLHDLFMIIYILLDVPWMYLSTIHSTDERARRWRTITFTGFMTFLIPLIYYFYRHSVLRIPGAYTTYAFFEWSLVAWDVGFDAGCLFELDHLQLRIVDASREADDVLGGASVKNGHANSTFFLAPVPNARVRVEEDFTAKPSAPSRLPYRDVIAWLSDVWFATAFWTVYTSVFVQLFYWSVWSLSFTGSELAIFINVAPHVFSRPGFRAYATSREGLFTHRAIMFIAGLGCWAIPSVAARYLCILVAMWAGWGAYMGDAVRLRGSPEMVAQGQIFKLGLVIAMLCKYNAHSNNPFWPIVDGSSGGWNKTGLFLSILALVEYYYRPNSLFPAPPRDSLKDKPTSYESFTRTQRVLVGLGLAASFHLLQTYAEDAGTILAWTWSGFPVTGPTLHPWSGVVIAVALAAVVSEYTPTTTNVTAIGAISFVSYLLLDKVPDWIGFIGGLEIVYIVIVTCPPLLRAASAMPPAVTGHGMAYAAFLDVASVFTVAYAFVPFGWILRERIDIIIIVFCLVPLTLGLYTVATLALPGEASMQPRSAKRVRSVATWTRYAVAALGLATVLSTVEHVRKVSVTPKPYYPDHNIFSGGIFTVHFGIDEPGRDSQRRIAQLVKEMEVDVLGMLETDLHRYVYGNRDLTRYIAEELGYYVDIGPGPNKHTWGACLLSKFPILNSTHHLLPSPHGELAPAIHATLDINGQHVNVLVSHNGQEEDALDRKLQTTELARLLHETGDAPTVFLGYLITRLHDKAPWPYGILFSEHSGLIDIETLDKWRWCEYIGFRGLWRIGFARLEHDDVTDTELQVGKFILPLPGQKVRYDGDEQLYWHIGEDDVPEPWRMPRMFRDEGVRGHAYRIWDGPLYYQPPEHSRVRGYGWGWDTEWPPRGYV